MRIIPFSPMTCDKRCPYLLGMNYSKYAICKLFKVEITKSGEIHFRCDKCKEEELK